MCPPGISRRSDVPGLRVYLPYQSIPVRVRLGYDTDLSRLETAVLRGIVQLWRRSSNNGGSIAGVGLSTVEAQFGLGQRVMLDLMFDFWRREYVALDLYNATVAPLPAVVAAANAGELDRLASGEFKLETVDVWFDRVSGHLTGRSGYSHPPERHLIVPSDPLFKAAVSDVRGGDVVRAVEEVLTENARGSDHRSTESDSPASPRGRPMRVMESSIAPRQMMPVARRTMWFPVDIAVREDPDSHEIRVTATSNSHRSAERDEKIGHLLTQFVVTRPDHPFSMQLRGSVEIRLSDPPSLTKTISRLRELAEGAESAMAGTRQALHAQLIDMLRGTRNQVEARISGEVHADIVRTQAEYRDRIRSVIKSAKRQLVLVSSMVLYEGVSDLLPELAEAVDAGVQVVVMWANPHRVNSRKMELDPQTKNLFTELRMRAVKQLSTDSTVIIPRQPSNFHASLAIADNHTAMVGGYSFLGRLDRSVDHFGVLVRAPTVRGCEAVESMLRWVRNTMTESTAASALLFRERDFHDHNHEPPFPLPEDPIAWSSLPAALQHDASASEAAVRAWAMAWRRCAAEVDRVFASRERPSVTLVEDAMHRDALWDSIRSAKEQVVIAGGSISAQVVNPQLVRVMRERLAAGVRFEIFHQHVEKGSDANKQLLDEVGKESPTAFRLHRLPSGACAVVTDADELVVGGFDFLLRAGFYRTQPGRRPAAELSLRITGGNVAAQACEKLGLPAPRRRRQLLPRTPLGLDHRGNQLLVGLEAHTDPLQRALLIHEAVQSDDGGSLLDDLLEVGADSDILRIAVASKLRDGLSLNELDLARWANWLIADLWSQHRFVEAWVLRRGMSDGALPLPLAGAAAFADTPRVVTALSDAALDDGLSEAATAAVIAFTASQVLAWQGAKKHIPADTAYELREVLGVLVDAPVAACWTELAAGVLEVPTTVDAPGLGAIARTQQTIAKNHARLAEAWERAARAVADAKKVNFVFEAGSRTHAHLFHSNGTFGQLADAVDRLDIHAVRQWINQPDLGNLGAFLDAKSNEVMAGHKKRLIHSGKRKSYLERLLAVKETAQEIANLAELGEKPQDHHAFEARPIAMRVAALSPKLRADLAEHPAPERHLTQRALDSMQDIVEWGLRELN